jgi:hypothetical protein
MNFWVRNTILGIILASIAFALLNNVDLLTSFTAEPVNSVPATSTDETQSTAPNAQKKQALITNTPASKNAAAEGLSRFYAALNPDLAGKGPKIRNGVVYLPDPKGDLRTILEARRMVTRPLPKKWKGIKKSQAFREGHTLYQKLTEYAQEEGLEIIWRLNRDLLVKSPFRINKEITKMSLQIGQAVNGLFEGGVSTYFCYKHRAIVFIEYRDDYLDKECLLLKPPTPK